MKECFGYIRVSTVKQGEGVSLGAQREAIERFAAQNGISITRWFAESETAAKLGRPQFGAMLKALKAGKAAGVVMHKIDRSARNFADWAKIGDLADAGIDVHFATESLDFRSRGGRLAADIQAVIAADYIRNLREEVVKGLTGRLKQGVYPFAAPIGYLDNGGGKPKTLDPERAPLVRQAFELYASGAHSLRSLTAEMARRGLRTRGGKPLSKTGLEKMLGNPFYCGVIRIRRTGVVYEGVHEPLVPVQVYQRVQEVRAGKAGKKVTRHNHTYRGLFRCGLCGGTMTAERQKGHVYYRCHTDRCPTTCVREEALDAAIAAALSRVRLTDAQVDRFAAWAARWAATRSRRDETYTLRLQLGQVDGRLNRLTDALLDGLLDRAMFEQRKEALLIEKSRLEQEAAAARQRGSEAARLREFLERVKSLGESHAIGDPREKRRIAEMATSNRTVSLKDVCVEPADWLLSVETAVGVHYGGDQQPTSRRSRDILEDRIDLLISAATSEKTRHALEALMPDETPPQAAVLLRPRPVLGCTNVKNKSERRPRPP